MCGWSDTTNSIYSSKAISMSMSPSSHQQGLTGYSIACGLVGVALTCAMQTDAYRSWYKAAFKPWGFEQSLEYYAILWTILWLPVFALGVSILFFIKRHSVKLEKPYNYLLHRRWLPSVTVLEALAFMLHFLG